ncbi:MAG: response regulator [Lachnospiraceae bacterium]
MEKIKVLIVDDERLAVEDLKNLIDWPKIGFEVVATASNGKQGLLKFKEFSPEVVITDIRMPIMDGIEFVRKLRESEQLSKILLLTAYEDFGYAKSAIQYGINDYIVKGTITEQSLNLLLEKLKQQIEEEREIARVILKDKISEYLQTADETSAVPESVSQKAFLYLIVEQNLPLEVKTDYNAASQKISVEAIIKKCEQLPLQSRVAVSKLNARRVLLLLECSSHSKSMQKQKLLAVKAEVADSLAKDFGTEFTIFTEASKMTLEQFKKLYIQHESVLEEKYWISKTNTIDIGEIHNIKMNVVSEKEKEEAFAHLKEGAAENDCEKVKQSIRALFELEKMSLPYLKCISKELYSILEDSVKDLYGRFEIDITAAENHAHWGHRNDLQEWFLRKFEELHQARQDEKNRKYSKVTQNAIDYVKKNYMDKSLSVKDMADSIHVSMGYLSMVFKKETGQTLNSYITETRVEAAKRMLSKGNRKIYEIADAVGYHSSQYFSQIFLKQEACYPSEYTKK